MVWLTQVTNSPAFNEVINELINLGYGEVVEQALQDWADSQVQIRADDDAIPIPFPQDQVIPDDYKDRFDIALGISQHLTQFAASFVDYPTVPFLWWPDWMITDSRLFTDNNSELIASIVIASLRVWAASPSSGVIKFNLEGIRDTSDEGAYHRITLTELRNLLAAPDLLSITHFYRFEMGVPRRLLNTELAEEIALTTPLFGRL
jgi:hypothetical protein